MKTIFLDRDGTLIKEKHYLNNPEDVELEHHAVEGLKRLQDAGYTFIIITNQSGIARGKITLAQFEAVQAKLLQLLKKEGISILDTFYCPHHPTAGASSFTQSCRCRKPEPSMLLDAIKKHSIDPTQSVMIGDKLADVEAGQNAGVRPILVETGYGKDHATSALKVPHLLAAAEAILS